MMTLAFTIAVWGIIFYVLWWALGKIALAEPFNALATFFLVIATLYVVFGLFLGSVPMVAP